MNNGFITQKLLPALVLCVAVSVAPALAETAHDHQHHDHEDHSGHDHHNHDDHDHDHDHDVPEGTSTEDQELLTGETVYTCSMHPQVRSANPDDRCPICGMALVPVEQTSEDPTDGPEVIRLSPRAVALAGIVAEPVQRRALEAELSLPGRVALDETRQHTLSARMAGRLDRLHINYTGASVSQGDVVAEIYSPELLGAQEELLQAVRLNIQESRQAARERLRLLGLATQDIDAIEESGEVREHLPVRATASGVVVERRVSQGDYVQTGEPLYTLADLSRVWVQLEVYETDLPHLTVGQHVHMEVTAHPGEMFHGEVVFVDPFLDEQRRTARARVELNNPEGQLKPGMLVQGQLVVTHDPGLAIPATAPLLTGKRALVYVQEAGEEGRFSLREVVLGPRAGDYYPVLEGLSEGEQVVSHGSFRLDSERQVRGLSSMMAPEGNGPPAHDHGDDHTDHDDHDDHADHDDHGGHEGHNHE